MRLERAHEQLGGERVVPAQPLGVGRHLPPRLEQGQAGQRRRPLGRRRAILGACTSGGGGGGGGGGRRVVGEEAFNDEGRPLARERGERDGQLEADLLG